MVFICKNDVIFVRCGPDSTTVDQSAAAAASGAEEVSTTEDDHPGLVSTSQQRGSVSTSWPAASGVSSSADSPISTSNMLGGLLASRLSRDPQVTTRRLISKLLTLIFCSLVTRLARVSAPVPGRGTAVIRETEVVLVARLLACAVFSRPRHAPAVTLPEPILVHPPRVFLPLWLNQPTMR
jgi:hypothetical protein